MSFSSLGDFLHSYEAAVVPGVCFCPQLGHCRSDFFGFELIQAHLLVMGTAAYVALCLGSARCLMMPELLALEAPEGFRRVWTYVKRASISQGQ